MNRLSHGATRLAQRLAACAVGGLLLLALGTAIDVLLRYGFASPIRGFVDVVGLAGAVLLSACMPYVVACRGNISIDFLGKALGRRMNGYLDAFGSLVTGVFFAVLGWQYVLFALDMKDSGQTMPVLRWPVWPWWSAVAVFIVITAAVALLTFRHDHADDTPGEMA